MWAFASSYKLGLGLHVHSSSSEPPLLRIQSMYRCRINDPRSVHWPPKLGLLALHKVHLVPNVFRRAFLPCPPVNGFKVFVSVPVAAIPGLLVCISQGLQKLLE